MAQIAMQRWSSWVVARVLLCLVLLAGASVPTAAAPVERPHLGGIIETRFDASGGLLSTPNGNLIVQTSPGVFVQPT